MTHFFADDGEKIHVQVSGDGSPILMLHGWTASHREWQPFLEALTAHHRVFRWDARGHGGHRLTQATVPTVQRMAQDLNNLIENYALDELVVVGHSMGALTLWQYIGEHGCRNLHKLVFIDQSPKLLTDDSWSNGIYGNFDREQSQAFLKHLEDDFAESVLRLGGMGLNVRARQKYHENSPGSGESAAVAERAGSGATDRLLGKPDRSRLPVRSRTHRHPGATGLRRRQQLLPQRDGTLRQEPHRRCHPACLRRH
jgi:non-heme chloroperoxidase